MAVFVSLGDQSLNAIDLPSGDQLMVGKSSQGIRVDRSFFSGPPSAGTVYSPLSGPDMRRNAISVPSGDHAALIHSDGCRVSRRSVSLPMAFT